MIKNKINTKYLISLGVSILLAFAVGAVILLCTGHNPLTAYGAMLSGAFSAPRHIGDVLEYAMVLALCGLACDLGSRVGIFNVGGEGQLLLGAIMAARWAWPWTASPPGWSSPWASWRPSPPAPSTP